MMVIFLPIRENDNDDKVECREQITEPFPTYQIQKFQILWILKRHIAPKPLSVQNKQQLNRNPMNDSSIRFQNDSKSFF